MTPYYNRPSPAGLSAHFRAIAAATDLPVLLYDIPVRSGRRIGADLTLELAREVATIVGVKDATGDVAAAAEVVAESPAGFDVYCGDDSLTLPFASIGGAGIISVAAHWAGPLFAEMISRHRVRRRGAGHRRSTSTWPSPTGSSPPTSSPTRSRPRPPAGPSGLAVGQCRLPNAPAPAALDDQARAVMASWTGSSPAHQSVA